VTEVYLDSSALVKLAIDESESAALRAFLAGDNPSGSELRVFASDLTYAESVRVAKRHSPVAAMKVFRLFEAVFMVHMTSAIYRRASLIAPPELRTLDALHVSAAAEMPRSSAGMVTYDERLAAACELSGIRVFRPE
jgi:uncharacterized protein